MLWRWVEYPSTVIIGLYEFAFDGEKVKFIYESIDLKTYDVFNIFQQFKNWRSNIGNTDMCPPLRTVHIPNF